MDYVVRGSLKWSLWDFYIQAVLTCLMWKNMKIMFFEYYEQ